MDETYKLALLGQACGDAFGAPFEYSPDAAKLAKYSARKGRYLDSVLDAKGSPDRARIPGLYTDDTQQALALLFTRQMELEHPNSPETHHQAPAIFLEVLRRIGKGHRGTGRNFREVLQTGRPVNTAGLGAAMRVGPVATTFDNPEEMIRWVLDVSAVTTSSPIALASAARYAIFVWAVAHPEGRGALKGLDWPTDRVPGEFWQATTQALRALRDGGEDDLLKYADWTGWADKKMTCAANGFALTGFAWAVDRALRADSFERALIEVCASGGDTDTVGAMAGCLAALKFGRAGIPKWMVEGLVYNPVDDPVPWTPETEIMLSDREQELREQKRMEVRALNGLIEDNTPQKFQGVSSPPEFQPPPARVVEAEEQPVQDQGIDFVNMAQQAMEPAVEPVLFGGEGDDPRYKVFSNFTLRSFVLDGETWPSVEHYYVAQKNPDDAEFQKAVRTTAKPGKIKKLGYSVTLRDGWDEMKYEVMKKAVLAKFSQNPDLKEVLLSTGDRPIHENRKDPWWGGGPNYKGCRDWLGQVLVEVRTLLRG